MLEIVRAIGGWRLAAVVAALALAVVSGVLSGTESRRSSLRDEVRWLRARLAEKRAEVERQRREMATVARAVEQLVGRTTTLRARTMEARRLANMEQSLEPPAEAASPAVMPDAGGVRVSEEASRALQQLAWLDAQTAVVTDSVAVLAALLRQPEPVSRGGTPSLWPVRGLVTSSFGVRRSPYGGSREMHAGIDIRARYGSPVTATAAGRVVFAGRDPGYGGLVVVDHGGSLQTLYGHLSALYVHEGQRVRRGQPIGAVGASGRATGSHLHYEVRIDGRPVDPDRYLASVAGTRWARGR
jgi:murein DD-endopeptidase MepM/ murein hydrolase activator NlpD